MRPIGPEYLNPEHRLPTLVFTDEHGWTVNTRIPIHPEPSFFETTTAGSVTHAEVERVMARPKWDFEEANLRLFKEKKAREAAEAAAAKEAAAKEAAAKPPAKRAAAKKTTAKRAPAKKAAPTTPTRKGNEN